MYKYIKMIIDRVISVFSLIILLPFFLLIAVAIRIDTPGPIFFSQKRLSINKKLFTILKFRTMKIDTPKDTPTHLLENPNQWISRVGRFLRKTSLDELPQLVNIAKGEMSFIGPRPALWNQFDLIDERDRYGANDVLPGISGWAQVNGRDELPISEKAKLDGEYVRRKSFRFDLICVLGTLAVVLRRRGVIEGGTGIIERMASQKHEIQEKIEEDESLARSKDV